VKHVFVDGNWFEIHEEAATPKSDEKKPTDGDEAGAAAAREIEGVGR
jgi:hypothetical protein